MVLETLIIQGAVNIFLPALSQDEILFLEKFNISTSWLYYRKKLNIQISFLIFLKTILVFISVDFITCITFGLYFSFFTFLHSIL